MWKTLLIKFGSQVENVDNRVENSKKEEFDVAKTYKNGSKM